MCSGCAGHKKSDRLQLGRQRILRMFALKMLFVRLRVRHLRPTDWTGVDEGLMS